MATRPQSFFAKTEISEMAPEPTPVTFALLEKIYAEDGPVQRVYKKYGISYSNTHFLKIIGNELVVEKQKELQSLLPSYRYITPQDTTPKLSTFSGFFTTFKNIFALQKISVKNSPQIFLALKQELEKTVQPLSLSEFLDNFFQTYQIIFETNLLCGVAFKKLEFILKKEPIKTPEILSNSSLWMKEDNFTLNFSSKSLLGNSIEISDETEFLLSTFSHKNVNANIETWWKKLPEWRKKYFEPFFVSALTYNRLREYSRWLIVKKINELRTILLEVADKNEFSDPKNIYFCTLEEILRGTPSEAQALPRKKNHLQPTEVFSSEGIVSKPKKLAGVSSGKVTGVMIDVKNIAKYSTDQNIILYSKILTPGLTQYFHKIKGIVSAQGGVLSHIAIVAREHGIPVVVNFSPNDEIDIGDTIFIDGDTGEIKKLPY